MDAGSPIRRATNRDAEISKRVREDRLAKGISQTELGRAIDVTFQQVQKYENGKNRIGSGRLARIAAALDISVDMLFGAGKKQRHTPSLVNELTVDGADRLLRAYDRIAYGKSRIALLRIAQYLAKS